MINKHLAGRHNQKTHGRSSSDNDAFYQKYDLDQTAQHDLEHLNGLVWQDGYGLQDLVEEFNKSGLPVYKFMMDPDYDQSLPGNAPADSYFDFGTEDDPAYFNLQINGRANGAWAAISEHHEGNIRGKDHIDFMLTDGSDQLELIESVLKKTGHFREVGVMSDEAPIMLLADKGYRIAQLEKYDIESAYNYLEKKYNLRVPVNMSVDTKDILISDLLAIPHRLYPDVPLFEELLLNETMSVGAYKSL